MRVRVSCGDNHALFLWESCDNWYGVDEVGTTSGPSGGKWRVQRGGCWNDLGVTTAYRKMNPPGLRHNLHGFRVALEVQMAEWVERLWSSIRSVVFG